MKPRTDARLVPTALACYAASAVVAGGLVSARTAVVVGVGVLLIVLLGSFLSGSLLSRRPRRVGGTVPLALLAFVVASAVTFLRVEDRLAGGVGEALASGEEAAFVGVVVGDPRPVEPSPFSRMIPRWSVDVRVTSLDGRGEGTADAVVTVVGTGSWGEVGRGDRVRGRLRLDETRPGSTTAVAWEARLEDAVPADGAGGLVAALRGGLGEASSGLPNNLRGLVVGMTIGDTSGMPPIQREEMRIAGLTHLTAVSGAQFAILAIILVKILRALRWGRRLQAAVLVPAILGFTSLVHPEPSVVRAAWMGGVAALALWWGRPGQALPALSTAVAGLLLIDPFLSLSYGFALSVAATAGIVLWSPQLAAALARIMPGLLARALAVPVAAQVVCAPILVSFTSGLGSYSVLANLVALPFAALVTLLGLMSVIVYPLCAPAGIACAWVAGQAARPVAWAAHVAATLPGNWIPWPDGAVGAVLAGAVSASLIAATMARVSGWARVAAIIAVLSAVAATPPMQAVLEEATARAPEDWAVAVCDVGQGDMILIRAGPASAVVIDTGPDGEAARSCLSRHGVSSIPLIVITHPHSDHDGGLEWVAARTEVGEAWVSEPGWRSPERAVVEAAGIPVEVPASGTSVTAGEVRLTVWHMGDPTARTDSEVNDASLVVWAESRGISLLSLGDLGSGGQAALARDLGPSPVDVLKVAHHGSSDQDPGLIDSLVVALAVVSVGRDNPYGHPAASTLAAFPGAPIFRTDECGDVDVSWRDGLVVTAGCPLGVGG